MKPMQKPTPLGPTQRAESAAEVEVRIRQSAAEAEDKIRGRAYELYVQRGGGEGHALDDWLQAESEVNQKEVAVAA